MNTGASRALGDKNKVNRRQEIAYYRNMFDDTKHMATILGYKFNPNMTKEKLLERHDEYDELTSKNHSSESTTPFSNYESLSSLFATVTSPKYVVTAFQHAKQMSDEGRDQHHCLGSYANKMYDDTDDIFFSIKHNNGGTYSNVQLSKRINDDNVECWTLMQHYKKFNMSVDCKEAKRLVNDIIDALNK